ncbi:MAG: radical SAM protein [Clostridia bacterium]|nr:radical SAM protein [Clostridia bacterium]
MKESSGFTQVERRIIDRATQKRAPVTGGFELTPYCNLACKMCYVKETAPGLPVLDAVSWLDFGRQAAQAGTLVVQLTGGEPMLHPQFREIYSGLKALGMVITMNTNATLIDEDMADFLAANMPRRMNVSLYGPNREVYQQLCGNGEAFDKTIRAIELMKARNIPVKINIVPNTISFPHLDEMLEICKKYELAVEMTPYLFEPIRKSCPGRQGYRLTPEQMAIAVEKWHRARYTDQEMAAYSVCCFEGLFHFDVSRKTEGFAPLGCRAGSSSFWLCWDGMMNACVNMIEPRADVRELGFAAAWERVKEYAASIRVPAKCRTCTLTRFCQSCAAVGYHENGTFEKEPQIMCVATEAYARSLAKSVRRMEKKKPEESK